MLTDRRVIEVQELRPIDFLAMIATTEISNSSGNRNLEEFIEAFSARETCSMLLHLYLESDNIYIFSKKVIEDMQHIKLRDRSQLKPLSKSQVMLNRKPSFLQQSGYLDKGDYYNQV